MVTIAPQGMRETRSEYNNRHRHAEFHDEQRRQRNRGSPSPPPVDMQKCFCKTMLIFLGVVLVICLLPIGL